MIREKGEFKFGKIQNAQWQRSSQGVRDFNNINV